MQRGEGDLEEYIPVCAVYAPVRQADRLARGRQKDRC